MISVEGYSGCDIVVFKLSPEAEQEIAASHTDLHCYDDGTAAAADDDGGAAFRAALQDPTATATTILDGGSSSSLRRRGGEEGCSAVRSPAGRYVLEKTSPSRSYAPRLLAQAAKQHAFRQSLLLEAHEEMDVSGNYIQTSTSTTRRRVHHPLKEHGITTPAILYCSCASNDPTNSSGNGEGVLQRFAPRELWPTLEAASRWVISPKFPSNTKPSNFGLDDDSDKTLGKVVVGMIFERHSECLAFLQGTTVTNVKRFSTTLVALVDHFVEQSPMADVPVAVFLDKLAAVEANIRKLTCVTDGDKEYILDEVLPFLRVKYLGVAPPTGTSTTTGSSATTTLDPPTTAAAAGTIRIPTGSCHGDLTLSNILVVPEEQDSGTPTSFRKGNPMKVILIDFLDSFVESPLADLAKLRQDLKYGWTVRLQRHEMEKKSLRKFEESKRSAASGIVGSRSGGSPKVCCTSAGCASSSSKPPEVQTGYDAPKLFSIFDFLWTRVEASFAHHEWFQKHLPLFSVMNQLRVLQYAESEVMARYLVGTVRSEMEEAAG